MEAKVLPSPTQTPSNLLVWVAVGVVVVGAVYFGTFSCEGLGWHKEVFRWLAMVASVVALIAPSRLLGSLGRKAFFPVALFSGYLIIESAVAPFYPGAPQSFVEYGDLFLHALRFGPCG